MIELLSLAAMTTMGLTTDLPVDQQLVSYKPSSNVYIQDQHGNDLYTLGAQNREWVDLAEIPRVVVDAVLSAEDKNFWLHDGMDTRALARAVAQNVGKSASGQRLVGGSTISQQLSKLAFVGSDRSIKRKVREVAVARRMEELNGKPRVLELYLNEIYFGRGVYGVVKAAETWFGKSLNELKPQEAATLASMIKAPGTFSREKNRPRLQARRNWVLKEMAENGYLTKEETAAAQATEIEFVAHKRRKGSLDTYYEDAVRRDLVDLLGEKRVRQGGLRVTVERDGVLQTQLETSLSSALLSIDSIYPFRGTWKKKGGGKNPVELKDWDLAKVTRVRQTSVDWTMADGSNCKMQPYNSGNHLVKGSLQRNFRVGEVAYVWSDDVGGCYIRQVPEISGAAVAINSRTGAVIATAGGFDYDVSKFNRAQQAFRQPGSTIKPMTYAAAYSNGWQPSDVIEDEPIEMELPGDRIWSPSNADNKFYGAIQVEEGLYRSRNVPTLRLAQEVGFSEIWRYAQHLGLSETMPREWTITLGSAETTVTKMAGAYVSLLNEGNVRLPMTIRSVTDLKGNKIVDPEEFLCNGCIETSEFVRRMNRAAEARVNISAYASRRLKDGMRKVMTQGTGYSVGKGLPGDVIGKTGTTNFYRDAWFVGQTDSLRQDPTILAIYVGYDRPKPIARGATGGRIAGPIFRDIVLSVMNGETEEPKETKTEVRQETKYFVNTALNMRRARSTSSKVLQIVPKNSQLTNVSCSGSWCKGSFANKTGYLAKRFVVRTTKGVASIKPRNDRFADLRKFMRYSGGTYTPDYESGSSTVLASSAEYKKRKANESNKAKSKSTASSSKANSSSKSKTKSKAPKQIAKRKVVFKPAPKVSRGTTFVNTRKVVQNPPQASTQNKRVNKPTSNTTRKKKRRCKMKNLGGDLVQVCVNY